MKFLRSSLLFALLLGVLTASALAQITINGSGSYSTIQSAVNAAVDNDVIAVPNGTYAESVSITKSLTINGQSQAGTIVDPVTGSGFQINASAKDVTITNLTVTGAPDEGVNATVVSSLTLTNVTASNNGTGNDGSGFNVVSVEVGATLTGLTATGNARHGLSIRTSNVTVSGGTFTGNGVAGDVQTGSGILVIKETGSLSGVTIDGVTSSTNKTAGINIYAIGGTISGVSIGQTTTVTLTDNGSNAGSPYSFGGAAVLLYGAVDGTTITADATSTGSLTSTAGLVVLGTDDTGSNSPTNTVVQNSNITGYAGGNYAAGTMYATDGSTTLICDQNVDATVGNLINGVATGYDVEDALYHKVDDSALGIFLGPGNTVFVTPNSGSINRGIAVADITYNNVQVKAGTYDENVVVDKAITLLGDGATTIINPTAGAPLDVTIAGVTIQDIHLYLKTAFVPTVAPTATNVTFTFRTQVKVFLQGPYSAGTMSTALKTAGYVPLGQPYSGAPWSYAGTEAVGAIPANVVDWVLVELRTGTANATTTSKRAAFLRNDGQVIDTDSALGVAHTVTVASGYDLTHYVVVRHRNHLAVMTVGTVSLPNGSAYDFTTADAQAFGTLPQKDLTGAFGMWAGDVNGNGYIRYNGASGAAGPNDRGIIYTKIGGGVITTVVQGYFPEDVNMNGYVRYNGASGAAGPNDRGIVYANIGGTVITTVKQTQVPN